MTEKLAAKSERAVKDVKSSDKISLTAVLSGSQQTGGAYFQAIASLRSLLKVLPYEISVTVLDARGTFAEELKELQGESDIRPFDVALLPRRLRSFRDRVLTDQTLRYEILRAILSLAGKGEVRVSRLARFLDTSSTDLVYFASPAPEACELMIKPYVWTLWDLFHLDHPEFPELRTSGKFEARENFNYRCLRKAAAVVVDSPQLVEKATEAFGAKKEKFVVVPYSVPKTRRVDDLKDSELPKEIRGIAGQYFFYPAQLWSHKNHQRIVEAIRELQDSGKDVHAVFVGRDHGAGAALEAKIKALGIAHRIHILGYVHDNAIPALYRESLGLVMASYVGPNIPPLEAMNLGVPIIATNIHKNQLSGAALYFDPDNAQELAEKMVAISNPRTRQRLISASEIRLRELEENRDQGNLKLRDQIQRISGRIMKP